MTPEGTRDSPGLSKSAKAIPEGAPGEDLGSDEDNTHRDLILTGPAKTAPREPNPPRESETPPPKYAFGGEGRPNGPAATSDANTARSPSAGSSSPGDASTPPEGQRSQSGPDKQPKAAARPVSAEKAKMQSRLPALDDDAEVGRQKEQIVTRDGKADLGFTGTLLASASTSAPKGWWQEYRVYSTASGKHVFSKITRSIFADEGDKHEADVFDPAPTSVPSQLLRSAREMTRSRPMTWMDAAVAFFGFDPLAKILYRKLSVDFEERI